MLDLLFLGRLSSVEGHHATLFWTGKTNAAHGSARFAS